MYTKFLLPLDGSPFSEQALPHAIAIAKNFQCSLIPLKVLLPLASTLSLTSGAVKQAEDASQELANEYLARVAAPIQDRGFPVTTLTMSGRPHEEISTYAENEAASIIVMSSRGQSGVSRWLMGSVADRVVRSVNVPVFLIHTGNR